MDLVECMECYHEVFDLREVCDLVSLICGLLICLPHSRLIIVVLVSEPVCYIYICHIDLDLMSKSSPLSYGFSQVCCFYFTFILKTLFSTYFRASTTP